MVTSYSLLQALASCQAMSDFDQRVLSVFAPDAIRRAFDADVERERIYHSLPLFFTFLNQTLQRDSCRDAISRATLGGWLPAKTCPHNSAYCNARLRMSETKLHGLMVEGGQRLSQARPPQPGWRPIRVVDGSSTQLPDTTENQKEYPQPSAQRSGCGFPVLSFVALMDLYSGAILELETGDLAVNERTLFRRLWDHLAADDIVLGDRGFDAYADMALLLQRRVDSIFRLHPHRKIDLSRARKNGRGDWCLDLPAPVNPPEWASQKSLPPTLRVRIVEFKPPRGCRVKGLIRLVTTLLDPLLYPKSWLKAMYARRWEMEVTLHHIKTTMKLEALHGKSPAMCRKELYMGLLAYNLIRWLMLAAAHKAGVPLDRISFKGTWQRMVEWIAAPLDDRDKLFRLMQRKIASDLVPHRPNRREPRRIKGRPKNYPLLYHPRKESLEWELQKECH